MKLNELNGKQFTQIRDALLDAFDKHALREMMRVEMQETLEHVADGENLRVVVFNLITWAERQGRIEDLIVGAHRANQSNPKLRELLAALRTWDGAIAPANAADVLVCPRPQRHLSQLQPAGRRGHAPCAGNPARRRPLRVDGRRAGAGHAALDGGHPGGH